MRISARLLAGLLSLLMLCGLLPFSLFAVEATDTDTEASESESGKSYAESVAANNDMFFANDFSTLDAKSYTGYLNSTLGISNRLQLMNTGASVSVTENKELLIEVTGEADASGKTNDAYVNVLLENEKVRGKDFVIEVSFKLKDMDKLVGTGLIYAKEYFSGGSYDLNFIKLAKLDLTDSEGKTSSEWCYITGIGNKLVAKASETEFVNLKIVCVPSTGTAYFYVDGEYVCSDLCTSGYGNLSKTDSGIANPGLIRIGQLGTKIAAGAGIYIDDLYVYAASVPYGCDAPEYVTGSYIENTLAPYLSATGNRLLGGTDFEDANVTKGASTKNDLNVAAKSFSSLDGLTMWDDYYNMLTWENITSDTASGTQWTIKSNLASIGNAIMASKYTLAHIKKEESGNHYLSVQQANPVSSDAYYDILANGYKKGSSFVFTAQYRLYENTTTGSQTIAQFRWNESTARSATAVDGTKITDAKLSTSSYWVTVLTKNEYGELFVVDYQSTKNADGTVSTATQNIKVGQLYSNEFTTVSVAVEPETNTKTVYVNGYKVYTGEFIKGCDLNQYYNSNSKVTYIYDTPIKSTDFVLNSCRIAVNEKGGKGSNYGGMEIDNTFFYTGTTPIEANGKGAIEDGWVQDEATGYWRYYKDGAPVVGEQTIGGTTYYFNKNNGYVSVANRYKWIDLYASYTQSGLAGNTLSQSLLTVLAPTSLVTGTNKYTYLWGGLYTTAEAASGANNWLNAISLKATPYGDKSFVVNSSLAITNKDIDKQYMAYQLKDGVTGYDFTGFDAMEVNFYSNMTTKFGWCVLLLSADLSASSVGYVDGNYATGAYYQGANNVKNLYLNEGWNTILYTFQRVPKVAETNTTFVPSRGGTMATVTSLQFSTSWSDSAYGIENLNDLMLYFDEIYFIKYEPVKDIPSTGAKTGDDGITRYYINTYDYAKGWQDIDGDGLNDHYFNVYNGEMAVGNVSVNGVGYSFDDNGKLISDKASGFFTVNGIECIYIDGKLQTGAFEYDGVSYYANGLGRIWSKTGAVGYTYDKIYSVIDYDQYKDRNYIVANNFENLTVGDVYGSLHNNTKKGSVSSEVAATSLLIVSKGSLINVVSEKDANGNDNKVLKVTQYANKVDTYVNINFQFGKNNPAETGGLYEYYYKRKDGTTFAAGDIVLEFDIKIGEDFDGGFGLLQIIGYNAATNVRGFGSTLLKVNDQGYVVLGSDSTKVLCKLDTETYTNIAMTIDQDSKTCDLYVNGYKKLSGIAYSASVANMIVTELRMFQGYNDDANYTFYFDNMYCFVGDVPSHYDANYTSSKATDGWVTEGGVQRYYIGGLMRTSALEIDGVYYYFDSLNGVCTGTANGWIDSSYYKDGKKLTSQWFTENDKTYYFDADGNALKGAASVDGSVYYFNASTGAVEKMQSEKKAIVSATDFMNRNENFYATYNSGSYLSVANLTTGFNKNVQVNGMDPMDVSDYDYFTFDIYIGGSGYTDTYILIVGETETFTQLEQVTAEDGTVSYKIKDGGKVFFSVYQNDYCPGLKKTSTVGNITTVEGKSFSLRQFTYEDGTVEYYGRTWNYKSVTNNFEDLNVGWNTIVVPKSTFGAYASKVSLVQFATTGWSQTTNSSQYIIYLGDVNVVKLSADNVKSSATTGWVDGKFYKDSTVPTTGWFEYDEVKYYADAEGNIVTGNVFIDGKYYSFDENGKYVGLVSGIVEVEIAKKVDGTWKNVTVKRIYNNGEYQTGVVSYDSKTYICDENSGEMVVDTTLLVGDTFYDCGADGVASKHTKAWYTDANGNVYYTKSSGKITTGGAVIDDDTYFFGDDGIMQTEVFFEYRKNTYYAGADGKAVKGGVYDVKVTVTGEDGSTTEETKKAYFNEKGVWSTDNEAYEYDENGYVTGDKQPATHEHDYSKANKDSEYHWNECAVCGAIDESSKEAHKGGNATCTEKANCEICGEAYGDLAAHDYSKANKDSEYHWNECAVCGAIDESSKEAHDYSIENKDETYKWNECSCGAIDESSKTEIKNEWFDDIGLDFDGENYTYGDASSEWVEFDDGIRYFDEKGNMLRDTKHYADNICYVFDEQGRASEVKDEGLVETPNGSVYVTDNGYLARNGWVEIDGAMYYFDRNNKMATGTVEIDGVEYKFDENGKCISELGSKAERDNGDTVYMTEGGEILRSGWVVEGGKLYYFNRDGAMIAGKTYAINGISYEFDADGVCLTVNTIAKRVRKTLSGNVIEDTVYVSADGSIVKGAWVEFEGGRYYCSAVDGAILTGTKTINGVAYRFDENGKLLAD